MKKIFLVVNVLLLTWSAANAENCARYIDGDSTKTTPAYSIYRESFKQGLYADALPQWRNMFLKAPGFRKQTHLDGITMYSALIQKENDKTLRQAYIDTLFQIYNKQIECFGEDEYVLGKKAMDLQKYGKNTDLPEVLSLLEKYIKITGEKAFYYYVQTYFKVLVNQVGKNGITEEYAINKYDEITTIVDKNIANTSSKYNKEYKEVKSVIDDLYTTNFADKSNPEDCAKLLEIYLKKYKANPNDLATIKSVYLKTKGCADSTTNVELLEKLNKLAPNYTFATRLANIYIKYKMYDTAIVLYQNALAVESDTLKKADLNYYISFMKYAKEDFPASRDFAKEAIKYNPLHSRAYNLIGLLYLSSGPLCGPGTGFQSQIVLWPAFDYFNKVIEINADADLVTEAQKYISDYSKYLPTKAEITAKKLTVGGPYTVKCWINEETTVKVK